MSKVLDALDALIASFGKPNGLTAAGEIDRSKPAVVRDNPLQEKAVAALADWPVGKQPIQRDDDHDFQNLYTSGSEKPYAPTQGVQVDETVEGVARVEEISHRSNGQNGQYIYNQEVISIGLVQTAANFGRLGRLRREMCWHLEHGERVDPGLCAGCRRPIRPGEEAWQLADQNRVHIGPTGDPEAYVCLIAHGRRWRRAARAAVQPSGA